MPEMRRKYDPGFREGAVRIVRETGKPIAQVANDLGIHAGTLGNWVKRDQVARGETEGLTVDERARLQHLDPPRQGGGADLGLDQAGLHRHRDQPAVVWGLTEIPTGEGKLYLATVEDLASRRLPGFAIGEHHDAALAKAALCMAAAVRGGNVRGVVFHSDKGGEYTGDLFAAACTALGVTQSMGRVGSALDNAAAESFNSTLEHELLSRRHFATKDAARQEVAGYIDRYNHRRRHSSAGMLAPVAYEAVLAAQAAKHGEAA